MIKDKEWLKERVDKSSEIVSSWALGRSDNQYWKNDNLKISKGSLFALIDELDEPEKPIIPQFVADWIDKAREGHSISWLLNYENIKAHSHELTLWCFESGSDYNLHQLAKSWLNGYEVEKEPLYTVCFEDKKNVYRAGIFLYKNDGEVYSGNAMDVYHKEDSESHLTEKEIKDYDERFWQFAVPVEEEAQ